MNVKRTTDCGNIKSNPKRSNEQRSFKSGASETGMNGCNTRRAALNV